MASADSNNDNTVFLTIEHLLKFEWKARAMNFNVGRQKSNSVLGGRYASKLRGRGLDFEEARPYIIGDDIRNIDWRVTAKTGKTHTKVFTEEKEKPAFIFVDQSPSMGFGSTNKTKAVVAGEFASFIAHKIQKNGDRVGGAVYSGDSYDMITPKRDARNTINFLQKIIDANQTIYEEKTLGFEESIQGMVHKLQNIITHDFLFFVISDFYRYNKKVIADLSQIALHNDVILVKIVDPAEERVMPDKLVVSNKTHQVNLDGKNKKLRDDLDADFESNLEQFKADTGKYGISLIKINTVDPVELQLQNIFNQP